MSTRLHLAILGDEIMNNQLELFGKKGLYFELFDLDGCVYVLNVSSKILVQSINRDVGPNFAIITSDFGG